jgi:hypothetical protein
MGEVLWRSRLRWRMRGGTLWPAFLLAVIGDALLLHLLPIAGDSGPGLFAAVLLAGFLNLFVVAVCAPLAGRWLRRRRPGTPKLVADNQAGTAILGAVAVLLAIGGLVHRPVVQAAEADFAAQSAAARRFVLTHAPPEYQANVDRLTTWKQEHDLYRSCVPGSDPRRDYCLIVETSSSPPRVTPDRDQRPNATAAGVDNPGPR